MLLIRDKAVRKQVSTALRTLQKKSPVQGTLRFVDAMGAWLLQERHSSVQEINTRLSRHISTAYLGILALALHSIAINKGTRQSIIPSDWISPKKIPDPNGLLENQLVQATNQAVATVYLIEAGLDSPARIMLRTLHELCWLIPVLTADREKMILYSQGGDAPAAKKLWRQYFSARKLVASLAEIERQLGLPEDIVTDLAKVRDEAYEFYCQPTHSSYFANMILAYAAPFSEDGHFKPSLFGAASGGSESTLSNLNGLLFDLLIPFVAILKKIHGLIVSPGDPVWPGALCLTECFQAVYLSDDTVAVEHLQGSRSARYSDLLRKTGLWEGQ